MPAARKNLVILGSTGSIGRQTVDVIKRLSSRGYSFVVRGLAAGKNLELLSKQIEQLRPVAVCAGTDSGAKYLRDRFPKLQVSSGEQGLRELAALEGTDVIVNALVGARGLPPTLEGLRHGCTVALANKESLVIGGELVLEALQEYGGKILPIDSEHNAVFQCLRAGGTAEVERIILTASGGPFLNTPIEKLGDVRPEQALRHPNWRMGQRITIDSATMVNKGFEVIEAHYLFSLPYERIDVLIHPGSIIHSLVEYRDGSILAELASPDMRIPIQYALTHPKRIKSGLEHLDLGQVAKLEFAPLKQDKFPAFPIVLEAARRGGTAPAVINAADEVLVGRFLNGELKFTDIACGLRTILADHSIEKADLKNILEADRWARAEAKALVC
ncbi:MAG: 1-deoxy-D-xylulose-5-phosphate reductoisomerase [Candidatus Bipolaricaulota bacterium]|nr:1-deoxy-D-xylulose-5-phosphate reductoisomerase [Candidatus Bipolaricaulota bacterium]